MGKNQSGSFFPEHIVNGKHCFNSAEIHVRMSVKLDRKTG